MRRLIRRRAIPSLETRNTNDATGLAFAAAVRPDVRISAFFNQGIGDDLLRVSSIAAVNIRPSLVPEFKGVDLVPQRRNLINNMRSVV